MLLVLPPEQYLIADSIYSSSKVLDGRHFAEEFVRRRKLADKGIIESASVNGGSNVFAIGGPGSDKGSSGGGWSEVAKKGSATSQAADQQAKDDVAFKVVAAKKKGSRK